MYEGCVPAAVMVGSDETELFSEKRNQCLKALYSYCNMVSNDETGLIYEQKTSPKDIFSTEFDV